MEREAFDRDGVLSSTRQERDRFFIDVVERDDSLALGQETLCDQEFDVGEKSQPKGCTPKRGKFSGKRSLLSEKISKNFGANCPFKMMKKVVNVLAF